MIYTHKPIKITAVEYTQEMQNIFIALGKNPKENPIDVKLPQLLTAPLTWNWHTKKLHLRSDKNLFGYSIGEKEIRVGDYICRLEDSEKPIHFRLSKKKLEKYYTQNQ